jgi:hypothetical protein
VRCAKYVPVASDGRDVLLSMRTAHALRRARPGGKNQRRIADLPYLCLQVLFVRAVPGRQRYAPLLLYMVLAIVLYQ